MGIDQVAERLLANAEAKEQEFNKAQEISEAFQSCLNLSSKMKIELEKLDADLRAEILAHFMGSLLVGIDVTGYKRP